MTNHIMQHIEQAQAWANAEPNRYLLTLQDEKYPSLLKEISSPPALLYVSGNLDVLSTRQLAIVGARNASTSGSQTAEEFAYTLAKMGITITSGLAAGIDSASHRGALAANGKTIAVMGTGMQTIYPAANRQLAADIVANGGAIVSEFPIGAPAHATNFPRRNRIIAGLSVGVLIVEAALKSGSLITANYAIEQGREVFAIPGSIHHPLAKGCHHLIRQGAKLVESAQDILEELDGFVARTRFLCTGNGIEQSPSRTQKTCTGYESYQLALPLSSQQTDLLEKLDYALTPLDVIVLRSRLTIGEVSSILLSLELDGYIQSVPGGYMRIR